MYESPKPRGVVLKTHFFILPGTPNPYVFWFLDDEIYDKSYYRSSRNVSKNVLKISNVLRSQNESKLMCTGNNNNKTEQLTQSVTLVVNSKCIRIPLVALACTRQYHSVRFAALPQKVSLLPVEEELSAGVNQTFSCVCEGCFPAPIVTWKLGGSKLKNANTVSIIVQDY